MKRVNLSSSIVLLTIALAGCGDEEDLAQLDNITLAAINSGGGAVQPDATGALRGLVALHAWWDHATGDNYTTSDPAWQGLPGETRGSYGYDRVIGWIFSPDQPQPANTTALYTWYSAERGDRFLTSQPSWAPEQAGAEREGYVFERLEGYLPTLPEASANVPLESWWNDGVADNYASTRPEWRAGAPHDGYRHYRTEGYVFDPLLRSDLKRFNSSPGLPAASPIRNQGAAGRCQSFALVAAMEAAYMRQYGLTVDLSEQFVGYFSKVNWLDPYQTAATTNENQFGLWSGGSVPELLSMHRAGVRTAAEHVDLPYIDYEAAAGVTDLLGRSHTPGLQDVYNSLNWGPIQSSGRGPFHGMPQCLLEQPTYYGVEDSVLLCSGASCSGVTAARVEELLREGHELLLEYAAHAVLIVGYDRTNPSNPHLLVKNSWGYNTSSEDGLHHMAYGEVFAGQINTLSYITKVRAPGAWRELRSFGRWQLVSNMFPTASGGELTINHLPGSSTQILGDRGIGGGEARLGSFKVGESTMYRVNGALSGATVRFSFDFDQPQLPLNAGAPHTFEYVQSGRDSSLLAGFEMLANGQKVPGYATKGEFFSGVPAAGAGTARWIGRWQLHADGVARELLIEEGAPMAVRLDGVGGPASLGIGSLNGEGLAFTVGDVTYMLEEMRLSPGVAAGVSFSTSGELMGIVATRQ